MNLFLQFISSGGKFFCLVALAGWLAAGCSIQQMAANRLGDALSGGGATFSSDDDPELVKAALPFSLKLMESILAETPRHRGLLVATASGYTQYAYAFVQQEADELEATDLEGATALRARARRLYLRARGFGLRGLEVRYPGFEKMLRIEPLAAVRRTKAADVPQLYWTAASWAAAIAISKDDPALVAELPLVEAMIDRALELDENFSAGAIHSFLISYEMNRRTGEGDPIARVRRHFQRAMELSRGQQAGPLLALAEAVTIQKQDVKEFESLLNQALAIDPDVAPEYRLVNLILQRRARWLLARKDDLFLLADKSLP